jgi:hypothetical protein
MLRQRKSPQGRHDPSAFLTMCRGDEQGLSDRLTILSLSSCRNSAFAAANFSASSRRKRGAMGGLEVLMSCSTSMQTVAKDCSDAVSTRQHLCRRHHAVLLRRHPHAQQDPRKMIWLVIRRDRARSASFSWRWHLSTIPLLHG